MQQLEAACPPPPPSVSSAQPLWWPPGPGDTLQSLRKVGEWGRMCKNKYQSLSHVSPHNIYGSVCSKNSYERKSCNHTHFNDLPERILDVVKTKRRACLIAQIEKR